MRDGCLLFRRAIPNPINRLLASSPEAESNRLPATFGGGVTIRKLQKNKQLTT